MVFSWRLIALLILGKKLFDGSDGVWDDIVTMCVEYDSHLEVK